MHMHVVIFLVTLHRKSHTMGLLETGILMKTEAYISIAPARMQ